MKRLALLTATAAVAAATVAAPASAQYPYPNPYPNQYPYGNTGQNVIGSIINSVLGYGQYPYGNYGYGRPGYQSQQVAVSAIRQVIHRFCAGSVEQLLVGMVDENVLTAADLERLAKKVRKRK